MRRLVFCILALACISATASAERLQRRFLKEYGLSVAFPRNAHVCDGLSWTHLHGWGTPIEGDCEATQRRITIWADWNAAFLRTPDEAAYCSAQDGGSLAAGARLGLTFAGRQSVTCRADAPDGSILITVVTQAWRWSDRHSNPDPALQLPRVNYYAYLRTTHLTLRDDLIRFRQVLRNVRIVRPA
jgi:hypothetical protein